MENTENSTYIIQRLLLAILNMFLNALLNGVIIWYLWPVCATALFSTPVLSPSIPYTSAVALSLLVGAIFKK